MAGGFPRQDFDVSARFWIEVLSRTLNLADKPGRFYENTVEIGRDLAPASQVPTKKVER